MIRKFTSFILNYITSKLSFLFNINIYFGKNPYSVMGNAIILFPVRTTIFHCGLSGIISFKTKHEEQNFVDIPSFEEAIKTIKDHSFLSCQNNSLNFYDHYIGGNEFINNFFETTKSLKTDTSVVEIFSNRELLDKIKTTAKHIDSIINIETKQLMGNMGHLGSKQVEVISSRIEQLKDIQWCLAIEVAQNIKKIAALINLDLINSLRPGDEKQEYFPSAIIIFKKINSVLNSIDRLEVRGRDSAGISLLFMIKKEVFESFKKSLGDSDTTESKIDLMNQFSMRSNQNVLVNNGISVCKLSNNSEDDLMALTMVYKVAAEVGSLGDNIQFLRKQIITDPILQLLSTFPNEYDSVAAHTRWASVGAITEENCHPVDNCTNATSPEKRPIIHACLNGDIDNYLELKKAFEYHGDAIPDNITTDTKIIPIQVEKYLKEGCTPEEAFRNAVNDFEGSHAISMHTDLAPGKLFLAQKGSGQAIFIGISDDSYLPTSEVYGFIEVTPYYVKVDGEKIVDGKNGKTSGQIFILDQNSSGGLDGIKAMYYDGTPVILDKKDINTTEITSRDIDRQDFPHYFLKEISESPLSVEKTLQNRWKISEDNNNQYIVSLDENVVPNSLSKAISDNQIKRILFMGQGTAGVAALACSDILNYYMNDPLLNISSIKASELSGFKLDPYDEAGSMADTLIVAISQSGTTTDTNRTVDMVRERGAHTIAIVNRRDSDITFKVDGVLYTSSGRDIEMSVASTKAFYSQIVAGAILGLYITRLKGRRNDKFIANEVQELLKLPLYMKKVLSMGKEIEKSAKKLAVSKTYWAAVGSGSNKASADEIRIKLSELCYKTISSDFVEDKKHIDLSSEPLIIVCAAGTRESVLGDIIKDTAIFHAHKASAIVIANEGEERFDLYAEDIFHVPAVSEHLAPILNTLVGHIWGYYAALSINEASKFMFNHRQEIQNTLDNYAEKGLNVYEVILEEKFREKIAQFYKEFRIRRRDSQFPTILGFNTASDLTLLLKYLSGRIPISDFEIDFGKKGTALNMLNTLLECLGESINSMARPVDAIKHQAKTVTVGTSRISEKVEGILFDALAGYDLKATQLTPNNVIVLKNLQGIVSEIMGAILYKIEGLSILGKPTDESTIQVLKKEGVLEPIPSRVESDLLLKGTKKIIVRQGNVYIGKGRKDDRSIIVIPVLSATSSEANLIEHLLLVNIEFKDKIELSVRKKALGGKYEHIKNIVQENSVPWKDTHLEIIDIKELFGSSAEKIAEYIVFQKKVKSDV